MRLERIGEHLHIVLEPEEIGDILTGKGVHFHISPDKLAAIPILQTRVFILERVLKSLYDSVLKTLGRQSDIDALPLMDSLKAAKDILENKP